MRSRVQASSRGCARPSQDSASVAVSRESVMVDDDGVDVVGLIREGG